jgi:hypothetical protein
MTHIAVPDDEVGVRLENLEEVFARYVLSRPDHCASVGLAFRCRTKLQSSSQSVVGIGRLFLQLSDMFPPRSNQHPTLWTGRRSFQIDH